MSSTVSFCNMIDQSTRDYEFLKYRRFLQAKVNFNRDSHLMINKFWSTVEYPEREWGPVVLELRNFAKLSDFKTETVSWEFVITGLTNFEAQSSFKE